MKQILMRTVAVCLAAVLLYPVHCHGISARKAILIDGTTGRVLYEKNADSKSLIASTTKIMTALIVCEQLNVLDRVRIPEEAVGIEGSSMYLRKGEVLTVQELLYGLMLCSGNDAAVALAIYCGGSVEGFVQLMNDKARVLSLENTHFANPHGLDHPQHYSTARDLGRLACYAMENPLFATTVSSKCITIGERRLINHNKLLWRVNGADGVKTGFTKAAGRVLVSSAMRDGRRLTAVTIDDGNDWIDHEKLLEDGFSHYRQLKIVEKGEKLGTFQIFGGIESTVDLIATDDFVYLLAAGEEPEIRLSGKGFVYAPVRKAGDAGWAYICIGDKVVGKVKVVYSASVPMQS